MSCGWHWMIEICAMTFGTKSGTSLIVLILAHLSVKNEAAASPASVIACWSTELLMLDQLSTFYWLITLVAHLRQVAVFRVVLEFLLLDRGLAPFTLLGGQLAFWGFCGWLLIWKSFGV